MTFEQLRLKHPRLVYRSCDVSRTDGTLTVSYEFLLEPGIAFHPTVSIPYVGEAPEALIRQYAFHLGMVEAVSYWKAACPKELVVEAGSLTDDQLRFWYDLYLHGLGEFFYQNRIDFTVGNFLSITSKGAQREEYVDVEEESSWQQEARDLVMVGGGKDSAVTLSLLEKSERSVKVMAVNPTRASLAVMQAAGYQQPLIVKRMIDPKLYELNATGYLNGHTPYSALLGFLGVMVGVLSGAGAVIVSNEKSANEGNVMYKGMEINHQYSKSFRYEQMFREYCQEYLQNSPSYFSMLRPLNDLQISALFAGAPKFFPEFISCNVGGKNNAWCGRCAKCAFTYLVLFPFVPYKDMMEIFGTEYFAVPDILEHIKGLTGLSPVKPFECVGTRDESVLAVYLATEKYKRLGKEVPEGLLKIKSDLARSDEEIAGLKDRILYRWGDTYNLLPAHLSLLRLAWQKAEGRIRRI